MSQDIPHVYLMSKEIDSRTLGVLTIAVVNGAGKHGLSKKEVEICVVFPSDLHLKVNSTNPEAYQRAK